ncbi:MAG: NAD(P)/FAD-dependent oxidoreductase [Bacilli bacterium]|nr:NAD(P)/FAD-dependent oxidoreductase [Bacilli bacterium]
MYDLIIIGSGPAGINAAIYAKRSKLNVLVLEKETPGGKLNSISHVDNYLGFEKKSGAELATNFYRQFRSLDIPLIREEVLDIVIEENNKTVITNKNEYQTKAIIIATGRGQKKLKNFEKIQGISYCALCDANLYENKEVMIIGNNYQALEEAKYLSDIAKKVYLVYDKEFKELNKKNISYIRNESLVNIIEKDNVIKEVVFKNLKVKVDGLFVNLGSGPATYFCNNLNITNEDGYILTNEIGETNIPGIYAAGDIIKKDIYQIINAASEGAIAAINASRYIRK